MQVGFLDEMEYAAAINAAMDFEEDRACVGFFNSVAGNVALQPSGWHCLCTAVCRIPPGSIDIFRIWISRYTAAAGDNWCRRKHRTMRQPPAGKSPFCSRTGFTAFISVRKPGLSCRQGQHVHAFRGAPGDDRTPVFRCRRLE